MDRKQKSREDYLSRINSAIVYIEKNLGEPMSLNTIAAQVNFSPFHFHRIFKALEGENLVDFILRSRIEKAAKLLQENKDISIVEIAYYCGFSNQTTFSRAFRKHFGTTAKDFRNQEKLIFIKGNSLYDKQSAPLDYFIDDVKIEIKIKMMPEFQVAYCRHVGDFHQISKAYNKLAVWAMEKQLLAIPGVKAFTIYHDDPAVTDLSKIRQSACISVAKEIKASGAIGRMVIEKGKYIVGHFSLHPSEYEKAWNSMYLWLVNNGCEIRDAYVYELYENITDNIFLPQEKYSVQMCVPIK